MYGVNRSVIDVPLRIRTSPLDQMCEFRGAALDGIDTGALIAITPKTTQIRPTPAESVICSPSIETPKRTPTPALR